MARIRTIKPEFWTSEQILECSPIARLLFIGIWNFCDDAGNHVASLRTIKANVLPGDDIASTTIQGLLDELYANDLIDFYIVDNKRFLHITGWHHQRIDRPTYKHPEYKKGENDEKSLAARRTLDTQSPPEGKGMEGNSKGEEDTTTYQPVENCARENPTSFPADESKIPKPVPDDAPTRAAQVAVILRRNGACHRTHAGDKGVLRLVGINATDSETLIALELAKRQRQAAASAQPITAAYLVPIVEGQRSSPAGGGGKYAKNLEDMAALVAWADAEILAEAQGQGSPPPYPEPPALEEN